MMLKHITIIPYGAWAEFCQTFRSFCGQRSVKRKMLLRSTDLYRFVIISPFLYNTFLFLAYELWFKQIIYEIDSIRDIFMGSEKLQQFSLMSLTAETLKPEAPSLDERVMLDINKRFETLRKQYIIYL
jgi:hypothetical protein